MKKTLLFHYSLLILFIAITALISNILTVSTVAVSLIMGLAVLKFIVVSIQFMELKKAHTFWKVSVIAVLLLIVTVIILIRLSVTVPIIN